MSNTDDINELANEELLDEELQEVTNQQEMADEETDEIQEDGEDTENDDLEEEEDTDDANVEDDTDEEDAEPEEETESEKVTPAHSEKERKEQEKTFKMRRLLRNMLRDDDSEGGNLKDMFNDIQISGEWLKRHWSFLLIVFVCMLLFVTNRYQAQQEIIEESKLKQELNDWKYIWLTQFSELTRSSRQSHIEESLRHRGDSTLKPSKDAPFIIKVK